MRKQEIAKLHKTTKVITGIFIVSLMIAWYIFLTSASELVQIVQSTKGIENMKTEMISGDLSLRLCFSFMYVVVSHISSSLIWLFEKMIDKKAPKTVEEKKD